MKKASTLLIILLVIVVASSVFLINKVAPKNNAPVTVLMEEDRFTPENLTIKKDTTVIFKNVDKVARWPASNIHPTHTIYPEFDSLQPIDPGQSWSFNFDKVGAWKDHDHLIPSIRGIITVTE